MLIFDIEADGLLYAATKLHCIVAYSSGVISSYYDDDSISHPTYAGSIVDGIRALSCADKLVCHNYFGYDKPLLSKLYEFSPTASEEVDTQVLSYLLDPDRECGHSVEKWMRHLQLKEQKIQNEDWSKLTHTMLERCIADVKGHSAIYTALMLELQKNSDVDWTRAIDVENRVASYCAQQELNGVLFDVTAAESDVAKIDELCHEIDKKVRPLLSLEVISPYGTALNKPFLKTGGLSSALLSWYSEEEAEKVAGPFTRIAWEEPDLNKRERLKKQLLRLGWKPKHFTEKGSPQFTVTNHYGEKVACDSLEATVGELGKEIAKYYILRHRQSQIKGWLTNGHIREDGRIPAGIIPDATNTHRSAHRIIANVPRPSSLFGAEMRSYFKAPPGKKFVGADLSGLELRCLANRMKDAEYVKVLLSGDIHWHHAVMGGFIEDIPYNDSLKKVRDKSKKFIYTFLYGAGDDKIGETIGCSRSEAGKVRKVFLKSIPSLASLLETAKKASKRGWLKAVDGRKVRMRKGDAGNVLEHKALNTLLQCDGALVAKYSLILIAKNILSIPKYEAKAVIWYHDEVQVEVKAEWADEVGQKIVECFKEAGRHLGFFCPIDGEYKVGDNWKETH